MSGSSNSSAFTHLVRHAGRLVRHAGIVAATTVALSVSSAALAQGQPSEAAGAKREPEIIEFTMDVAEDLSGKFVPTLVKPEHTQPERGSFYVTEGRLFPAGTIQGDGADFDPSRSGHVGIWIARGTHLVSASAIPQATLWADTAQLFVIGRQAKEPIVTDARASLGDLRAMRACRFDPGRFADLDVPVLLQIGSESPRDLYVTDALAGVLPRVQIQTLAGQAHEGMTTAPALYADFTMQFLQVHEGAVTFTAPYADR